MSAQLIYATRDVGGGLVDADSLPRTIIPSKAWSRLDNFYSVGTSIRRRDGTARVTTSAYGQAISSLYTYKLTTGAWEMLAGAVSSLAKLVSGALVALPAAAGGTIPSATYPWSMRQFREVVYAARRDAGRLKRITLGSWQDAGIAAPSTAPTMADGGAGALPAATYYSVYRYRNSQTGALSNWSPVSSALALGASKKINHAALVASTNPQVDKIDIGRTLSDQTGEYFFVASVANGVTTYTGDQVLNADLGDALNDTNGLPPDEARVLEVFAERLWLSAGTGVYFSQIGLPESWNAAVDYLPVFDDDGHEVRALLAIPGQLVVAKTNALRYVAGVTKFEVGTLTEKHGCVAGETLKYALGNLIWYAGDNFYSYTGGDPRPLADKRIKALLDRVTPSAKQNVRAAIYPARNWYVAALPLDGAPSPTVEVVYNYADDTWATFTRAQLPVAYGDFWNTDYTHLLYAASADGHVYDLASGTTDNGTAIAAVAETGELGFESDGTLKAIQRVSLLAPTIGETVTLKAYRNGAAAAHKTRSALSLAVAEEWKRYRLSTVDQLAKTLRLGIEYSGTAALRIDGWMIEALGTQRRGRAA
jgi:hypothetical protein